MTTMRSEQEIRREVETRLRRRGLLIVDSGLWLLVVFAIFSYSERYTFGSYAEVVVLFMLFWGALLGLHTLAVLYIEVREWLVRRAIQREREFYVLKNTYEKQKRDDSASRCTKDHFPLSLKMVN
jgi:hypothetical protein